MKLIKSVIAVFFIFAFATIVQAAPKVTGGEEGKETLISCGSACDIYVEWFALGPEINSNREIPTAEAKCTKKMGSAFPIKISQVWYAEGGSYGTRHYVVFCEVTKSKTEIK